jgi:hypothetical protein
MTAFLREKSGSTPIRHVNGLIEPTAGRIPVYGEDVNRYSYEEPWRLHGRPVPRGTHLLLESNESGP